MEETSEERKKRQNRERQERFRKRHEREIENPAKRAKYAEDKKFKRSMESEDQRVARLNSAAASMRAHRSSESDEERVARLNSAAASMRAHRSSESDEERAARLDTAAASMRAHRSSESDEERVARLKSNAEAHRNVRAQESPSERKSRLTNTRIKRLESKIEEMEENQMQALQFDENEIELYSCGEMNTICQFCSSKNFIGEMPADGLFTICCRKGKVMLPKVRDIRGRELKYPAFLEDLLTNPTNQFHVTFRDKIRSINNAVSFASMGAKIIETPGRGPYIFKIHGQTYHRTSHLEPEGGVSRQYAQLYVVDSQQALNIRNQHEANSDVPSQILEQIDLFFRNHNRLAQTYEMIREIEARESALAAASNLPPPEVSMVFRRDRQTDPRRFNEPTANEIAMVFVNEDGEPPFERDIRIYPRSPNPGEPFVQINILSCNLDPMTYSLLYPYGQAGWQANWQCSSYPDAKLNKKRNNVSMLQYKAAQTAIRDDFNPIIHSGKLTQQWLVDSYLQAEANNLNYVRQHQKDLRRELYQGLMDHLESAAADRNISPGVPVILPSSFSGSPRNLREQCCDAMSIFANKGAPDLFITFTANPNWAEIQDNLEVYECANDRPDLVVRVFKLKLDELIDDLTKKMIFGFCIAFVYTIEFQKRGLPHAHILMTLRREDKFATAESIDKYVSAEIPSETNPRLREVILRNMMHGPCGANNMNAPCMENGQCKKNFPKDFCEKTDPHVNGYPQYRRRPGAKVKVRGAEMDNRFVVPYSPYLSLKFNAHINVEVCTSVRAIKYIYKYIFKGFDCASLDILNDSVGNQQLKYNEISNFISCRYVSPPEAVWRLRENKMNDRSHSVMRLPVHLPGQQQITFEEGKEEEAIEAAKSKLTKLEAYFKLNEQDQEAQQYLYTEIPHHYVYGKNEWKERRRGGENVVSRMYTVSLKDEERFYLRMLLLHVRGAKSFNDLRTFENQTYATFKLATAARGLLDTDEEWVKTLEDASTYLMPREMRNAFAYILCYCSPSSPIDLWERFQEELTLDFRRNNSEEAAFNLGLHALEKILSQHSLKCTSVGLPTPEGNPPHEDEKYNAEEEAADALIRIASLNEKQLDAFNAIRDAIDYDNGNSRCFYIDGPGGSGKTYLYQSLLAFVRGRGQIAMPFATTGIASTLLKGGRTAHSGFKLPVPLLDTSVSSMRAKSKDAAVLREASLIIIDEISVLAKDGLRVIDLLLREIMTDNRPFGGKVLVIGGDFRQTLPVVPNGTKTQILESCVKFSPLWKQFKQFTLIKNMRSENQDDHNEWLLKIGEGKTPPIHELKDPDLIEIPENIIETNCLISSIFGDNLCELSDEELSKRIIITATNEQALETNREIIRRLPGDACIYYSADSIVTTDPSDIMNYPPEFLHEQTPSGMPPHCLCLKKGVVIMLLRNLNPKEGLCNGTRLVVEEMSRNIITARIISECNRGDVVFIPRITLAPTDTLLPFMLKRRQYPVIPAFCITINKAQGQSYSEGVGIDLALPVFGHGQLYVAFSRSRQRSKIKVKIGNNNQHGQLLNDERVFTRNIVFKEIFGM